MRVTAQDLAGRFDVPVATARTALHARRGALPRGTKAWDLSEAERYIVAYYNTQKSMAAKKDLIAAVTSADNAVSSHASPCPSLTF